MQKSKKKKEIKYSLKDWCKKEVDRVECGRADSDSLSHSISPRPPSSLCSMIYNTLTELQWDHNDTDLKSQIYNTSFPSLTNYLHFPNIFLLSFSTHLQAKYFPFPNIFLLLFLPRSSFAPLTKHFPSPNIFLFFVLLCSSPPLTNMFLHFPFLCKGSSLTRSTCLFHSLLGKCSKKVVIFHDFCHKASHHHPTPPPLMALLATHFFIPLFSFAIESYMYETDFTPGFSKNIIITSSYNRFKIDNY